MNISEEIPCTFMYSIFSHKNALLCTYFNLVFSREFRLLKLNIFEVIEGKKLTFYENLLGNVNY